MVISTQGYRQKSEVLHMQVRFDCPTDGCVAIIEYEPLEGCGSSMECPRCHKQHTMMISDLVRNEQKVDRCAVCGCKELFIRKDFPQALGFAIVVVFGLAAIYYFRISVVIAWSILAGAILLDLLIYGFIGKVTTCYNCRAGYRKCSLNSEHEGFDLATSEKY